MAVDAKERAWWVGAGVLAGVLGTLFWRGCVADRVFLVVENMSSARIAVTASGPSNGDYDFGVIAPGYTVSRAQRGWGNEGGYDIAVVRAGCTEKFHIDPYWVSLQTGVVVLRVDDSRDYRGSVHLGWILDGHVRSGNCPIEWRQRCPRP